MPVAVFLLFAAPFVGLSALLLPRSFIFVPLVLAAVLTWGGLLLPLTRPGKRIIGTAVTITTILLAYGAGSLAWRNEMIAIGSAALAALGILLYRHIQEHNQLDPAAQGEHD